MACLTTATHYATSNRKQDKVYFKQISDIKTLLEKDINACDIKWTLFVVAAQSYRFGSRLSPCPTKYINKDSINNEAIKEIIGQVPTFAILLNYIIKKEYSRLDNDVVDIIHWVISRPSDIVFQTVKGNHVWYFKCNVLIIFLNLLLF